MSSSGLALRFDVVIEGVALGASFTACSGLGATYETTDWKEGGDNGTVVRLPARLTYSTVRLSRAVDQFSGALAAWFTKQGRTPSRYTTVVKLYGAGYRADPPVAQWTLAEAWPLSYSGPLLTTDASGESVAVETLELCHSGYTR